MTQGEVYTTERLILRLVLYAQEGEGSQSIFTLGMKTALCHVILMAGKQTKKQSERAGKTTLTEQESLTWVHGLT